MENELTHYGIKGMKWGVRRYQNADGSLTEAGRKHYGASVKKFAANPQKAISRTVRKAAAKDAVDAVGRTVRRAGAKMTTFGKKTAKKVVEKTETEEEKKARIESEKQKVLESRSAKAVYENAHLFSDEELRTAYNRLQLEQNIQRLAPAEVDKGQAYIDKVVKAGKNFNEVAKTGIEAYNNVAKLHNTFSADGKKNPWPLIKNDDKGDKSNDNSGDNKPNKPKNEPNKPKNEPNKPKNEPNKPKNEPNKPKDEPNKPKDNDSGGESEAKSTKDKAKEAASKVKDAASSAADKAKDWYENQQARQNVQDAPKTEKTTYSSKKSSGSDVIDMEWNESTGSFQMSGKSHTTSLATRGVTDVVTTSNRSSGQNYIAGLLED